MTLKFDVPEDERPTKKKLVDEDETDDVTGPAKPKPVTFKREERIMFLRNRAIEVSVIRR